MRLVVLDIEVFKNYFLCICKHYQTNTVFKFEINKKTCRICLEEDEEKTSLINPIVAACLCKESSGYIHVKCL